MRTARIITVAMLFTIGFIALQCTNQEVNPASEKVGRIEQLERQFNVSFYKQDIQLVDQLGSKATLRIASLNEDLVKDAVNNHKFTIVTKTPDQLKADPRRANPLKVNGDEIGQATNGNGLDDDLTVDDYKSIIVVDFAELTLGPDVAAYGLKVTPNDRGKGDSGKQSEVKSSGRIKTTAWWMMYSGTWPESYEIKNHTFYDLYFKLYKKNSTIDGGWGQFYYEETIPLLDQIIRGCDGPYMIRVNFNYNTAPGDGFELWWYELENGVNGWYETKTPYPTF